MTAKQILTLVVVYNDTQILLGMKKRGFGAGRWNGFGGKVYDGETIEQAAHRELQEEVGITTDTLVQRGILSFSFEDNNDILEVHIYSTNNYSGEIVETDEMQPQWFEHADIPYLHMWADDQYWLPHILAGKNVNGTIAFDNPQSQTILSKTINVYE